jgi:hypothetical protein
MLGPIGTMPFEPTGPALLNTPRFMPAMSQTPAMPGV